MRILVNCVIVAAFTAAVGSSHQLQRRYGKPDLERFEVRPGISLTVQYGPDGLACQASIEPPEPIIRDAQPGAVMSSQDVTEVLEEIAPVAKRGKEISSGSFQSGACAVGAFTDYQNVWIVWETKVCSTAAEKRDVSTLISFKRDICPKVKAPGSVSRNVKPD